MPRGVYDRKKVKSTKGGRKLIAAAKQALAHAKRPVSRPKRRRSNPGVVDDPLGIPTISKSSLVRSSITPSVSHYDYKSESFKHCVEVKRGDTLVIKFV